MMRDDDLDDESYGDSDLDYPDEFAIPGSECGQSSHRVITADSLALAQRQDLQKVVDMLGLKSQHARSLLIHYRWDVDLLCSHLTEIDEEKVFLQAGLPPQRTTPLSYNLPQTVTCGICFEDVSGEDSTQMDCSHIFCNDCWLQNFSVKIKEGQSKRLLCMTHKCNAICDEDKVRNILRLGDEDLLIRYDRSLLESYIDDNAKVKWCPSVPHCGNAIKIEGEPFCEIECLCSHQFCFNCTLEPHSPCSCFMWQLWARKCRDESETRNWITIHTKPCPKCRKNVEKNEGCNMVTCVCGQNFCWLCGAATGAAHDRYHIVGHSCGRYKEDIEQKAAHAQRFWKRYTHYHSRWRAHLDSLKFEAKQKEVVQRKIERLERIDLVVKDYSWFKSALQMLFRARRALSYSYPFAFYMFGNDIFKDDISETQNRINQNLFEDQQQQFEEQVERLSKLIEVPMEDLEKDVSGVRFQLVSSTALTDKLCGRLYDLIENDLLDSLVSSVHHIAPYRSQVERASSLEESKEIYETNVEHCQGLKRSRSNEQAEADQSKRLNASSTNANK